jgi:hypothetical protein
MVNARLAAILAKKPGERPTIATLRQEIREILAAAGGPEPVTRRARAEPRRSAGRRRVPVVLTLAASLPAVGGALLAITLLDPARSAQGRLRQATPIGVTCIDTAVPEAAADGTQVRLVEVEVGSPPPSPRSGTPAASPPCTARRAGGRVRLGRAVEPGRAVRHAHRGGLRPAGAYRSSSAGGVVHPGQRVNRVTMGNAQ